MPIKPDKNRQNWRQRRKKYYVSRASRARQPKRNNKRRSKTTGSYSPGRFWGEKLKRYILVGGLAAFVLGCLLVLGYLAWIARSLPDPEGLDVREVPQSTKIYDRTGEELLYEIHGEINRTEISLDEIPEYVKWATIAIEDKNFYQHKGISLWGIFRGVVVETLRRGRAQGGSTLTQQFVKNAILTPERTVTRKVKEWLLSYRIEKRYSKDEILEMYLNEIPYGSTAYGVEAASQIYFGKSVRDINLAEAAILAALPQAPSRYSPYGPNRELLLGRQQYIIELMVEQGYITEDDADVARAIELDFKPQVTNIKAPHFVMYVKEILSDQYGEKMVEQGGLKITTSLDLYKQEIAERIVAEQAEENMENFEASNAALVSLDPKTGQILAMVGSKDFFDEEIDGQVNITTSQRQPGSSMKPLVYAAGFLKGYTPNTILYDVVTDFSNDPAEPYEPHNYDLQEHGPVTIRKALAGSLNIPAVKAIYLAGIENVLDLAQELGYSTLEDRDRFGLSLVLGGGEVKLLEHTNAFGVFAREGILHPITAVLKVEDREGKVLQEFESEEKQVLDPKVARLVNNILSDNAARAYAFGERNWLTLGGRPVAAKTGTTNDYRDAWTLGYTPSLVTGVWVGNNDNAEMKRGAAGGTVAAPIWHDYMAEVLGDTPVEYFKTPEIPKTGKPILDGEAGEPRVVRIDKSSGLLATEHTPESMIEERTYFEPHSILYYVNKDDPLGDAPENPESDPQFALWEERVALWAEEQAASSTLASTTPFSGEPPDEYDNVHLPENIPSISVAFPGPNQTLLKPTLLVKLKLSAPRGIDRVEYYLNDNLFYVNRDYPFNLERDVSFLGNGFHNLRIRACDDVDNCGERELEFNLVLEERPGGGPLSVNWVSPNSGLAVNNIDFPLEFEFTTSDPKRLARINLSYKTAKQEAPSFITTIAPIENMNISGAWDEIPPSGTYTISAEAVTWDKRSISLDDITLIINNSADGT